MRKITLLIILAISLHKGIAQDATSTPAAYREIGLNITQTLAGFFNSGGQNIVNDPYLLSFKYIKKDRGFRTAFNMRVSNKNEFELSGFRKTKGSSAHFRAGYERRYPVAKIFDVYWAIDGVLQWNYEDVEFDNFGSKLVFEDKETGFGVGPALGVMFHLNKYISLSTEGSLYAVYAKGKKVTQLDISSNPQTEEFERLEWLPSAPASLYFIVRF